MSKNAKSIPFRHEFLDVFRRAEKYVRCTDERACRASSAGCRELVGDDALKALFESSCRDFITFKGGTSLSKGWHVIERFSEDIDIAIDKSFWEIAGDNKSQRDRIRKLSRAYIEQRLVAETQALLEGYGASDFELRAVPAQDSDTDPTLVLLPSSKHLCEYRVCGIANPDRIQLPVDERTA